MIAPVYWCSSAARTGQLASIDLTHQGRILNAAHVPRPITRPVRIPAFCLVTGKQNGYMVREEKCDE